MESSGGMAKTAVYPPEEEPYGIITQQTFLKKFAPLFENAGRYEKGIHSTLPEEWVVKRQAGVGMESLTVYARNPLMMLGNVELFGDGFSILELPVETELVGPGVLALFTNEACSIFYYNKKVKEHEWFTSFLRAWDFVHGRLAVAASIEPEAITFHVASESALRRKGGRIVGIDSGSPLFRMCLHPTNKPGEDYVLFFKDRFAVVEEGRSWRRKPEPPRFMRRVMLGE